MISHHAILEFWFGGPEDAGSVSSDRGKFWFRGGDEVDRQIRKKFSKSLELAARGELDDWRRTPQGTLALILVLDQLPRNMFRGSAQAYAYDRQAQSLCLNGLAQGIDTSLTVPERAFFYMPLEHAEDLSLQQQSVAVFTRLLEEAQAPLQGLCKGFLDYALRHLEVIERFGRFPHRNEVLGRNSTDEEIEFLKQPGSSF